MIGPVLSPSEAMFVETFTIRGEGERRSSGSAALMTRIAPRTLVCTSVRITSKLTVNGSCSAPSPVGPEMPALLIAACG